MRVKFLIHFLQLPSPPPPPPHTPLVSYDDRSLAQGDLLAGLPRVSRVLQALQGEPLVYRLSVTMRLQVCPQLIADVRGRFEHLQETSFE
eukprot:758663-Hanusia_phi.AAC.1